MMSVVPRKTFSKMHDFKEKTSNQLGFVTHNTPFLHSQQIRRANVTFLKLLANVIHVPEWLRQAIFFTASCSNWNPSGRELLEDFVTAVIFEYCHACFSSIYLQPKPLG